MSWEELAGIADRHGNYISLWELGNRVPSILNVETLAAGLGTTKSRPIREVERAYGSGVTSFGRATGKLL